MRTFKIYSLSICQIYNQFSSVQPLSHVRLFATPWTTARQAKSINSLALSCLYSPTLKSIHDNWKNHSLEAETLVLWPPDAKSWLIWKDPDAEKDLRAGGEGDGKGWDGWMASLTQWTWVWVNSGSWWWTGSPGMLQFIGSQGVGLDWATELNWTDKMDLFGKVKSLLFNILSRLVKTFLPRSNCLLISCLQSQYAVILEPQKIVSHCFHSFPIYLPWNDGTRCYDLSFLNVEF